MSIGFLYQSDDLGTWKIHTLIRFKTMVIFDLKLVKILKNLNMILIFF